MHSNRALEVLDVSDGAHTPFSSRPARAWTFAARRNCMTLRRASLLLFCELVNPKGGFSNTVLDFWMLRLDACSCAGDLCWRAGIHFEMFCRFVSWYTSGRYYFSALPVLPCDDLSLSPTGTTSRRLTWRARFLGQRHASLRLVFVSARAFRICMLAQTPLRRLDGGGCGACQAEAGGARAG